MISFDKSKLLVRHARLPSTRSKAILDRVQAMSDALGRTSFTFNAFPFKEVILTLSLLLVLMMSAIGVVYSSHISRQLFAEQAILLERNDQLQLEWAQLLLEQSALASPGQIESVAANELQMVLPLVDQIELVH